MNKSHEKINMYLDFYERLLTKRQSEVMNAYYREDYSLSEIGENFKITRSAVLDNIKRTSKILEHYEDALHLCEKYKQRALIYEELNGVNDTYVQQLSEKLKESEIENYE